MGRPAVALIKSSFVRLAAPADARGDNVLAGRVLDREDGDAASEVVLALAEGKTLVATLSRDLAAEFQPGQAIHALVAPSDVILAVD